MRSHKVFCSIMLCKLDVLYFICVAFNVFASWCLYIIGVGKSEFYIDIFVVLFNCRYETKNDGS